MRILLVNFAECPENLHFEQALNRAFSRVKGARLDIIHDFRFPYSFIARTPPAGGGFRSAFGSVKELERRAAERYDLMFMVDFPKRKACAAAFLWLVRRQPCAAKVFIANHLLPMPGHNPSADMARRLRLLGFFDRAFILDSDDADLWAELGTVPGKTSRRGYAVDCGHYVPARRSAAAAVGKGYIFSAGSAGRDFSALARAAAAADVELRVLSDGPMPPPPAGARVRARPLAKNLHELKTAMQGARAVAVPVADSHVNASAGNSIAFLAMACGRPVIVKRTPYMERFVADGKNGFFYDTLDDGGLSGPLSRALALAPAGLRRLGKAARASVLAKASLDRFARGLAGAAFRRSLKRKPGNS